MYRAFDTHHYIKELQKTGFNEAQAEMLVKSLLDSKQSDFSHLATKEQVAKVEARLQKQISDVKSDLMQEISDVKVEITELRSDLMQEIADTNTKVDQLDKNLNKEISITREAIKQSKIDVIKWIIPIFFTNIAMIVAVLIKLFV